MNPPSSTAALATLLRELCLLEEGRQQVVERDLVPAFVSGQELADELVRRGWLTSYQATELTAGRTHQLLFDQYEILRPLGRGAMGTVYLARQRTVNRLVALKVIRAEVTDPEGLERFRQEAKAVARLSHPNVVSLYDAREAAGVPFLVMEYVEGTDLGQVIRQGGPLSVGAACDYVAQAARGLQHAHERGLIHRDIKPSNLMLTAEGTVKVMDLGLARQVCQAGESSVRPSLTETGAVMGTADYLAPEQAEDAKRVDIRADIYSLGCTLFHLLAGRPPYPGETLAGKIAGHLFTPPPDIAQVRGDVPQGLSAVLRRMMAKAPEDRFATPVEVARALKAWVPARPSGIRPASTSAGPTGTAPRTGDVTTPMPRVAVAMKSRVRVARRALLIASVSVLAVGGAVAFLRPHFPTSPAPGPVTSVGDDRPVLDLGDGTLMELVRIPAGRFWMGSPDSDKDAAADEKPSHEVAIHEPFLLGKYPVTQQQYLHVMGKNPSAYTEAGNLARLPVESVSWEEAREFCIRAGIRTGRVVELPTEAEWEYACRGGTRTRYYCGDALTPREANFGEMVGHPTGVGQYPANPWGLHDMAGNVWQWCADGKRPYEAGGATPIGPANSPVRMARGGSWHAPARYCRAAYRIARPPTHQSSFVGFRVLVRSK